MNTIKKITLTPLDKFFFGGENFFDADDGVFYFQTSRDFPQQTTLLGLIRHQILLQNNLMKDGEIDPAKNAANWIGQESFTANNTSPDFKKIKRLSPAFITHEGVRLQPHWMANQEEATADKFTFGKTFKASFHGTVEQDIALVETYTEKHGIQYGFKETDGTNYFKYDEVYDEREAPQIGIDKQSRYTVDDDARGFYKFKYCRLKPKFAFSFYVEIEQDVNLKSEFITMGKERSAFKMTVEDVPDFPVTWSDLQPGSKIVLLSDTRVENKIYDYCDTIISDTISFKNIKNTVKGTTNYSDKPTWSNRMNLLKRGSILHISNQADMEEVKRLLNQANFQKIGYNYYTNY